MRNGLLFLQTTLLCLGISYVSLDLGKADLRVPFSYSAGTDVHFFMAMNKTIAETGWYFENPRLGAPGRMWLYDFPFVETGTFLGIKLLILLTGDPFLGGNLFYLATYLLAAWTALFVLLRLGVHPQVAVAAGLLFAFTPYHFWRGAAHVHLSAYYPIPLAVLVSLWLARGQPLLWAGERPGRPRLAWVKGYSLTVIVACILVALGGPYTIFFGLLLILVGGVMGVLRKPSWRPVADLVACLGLVIGLALCQVVPFLISLGHQGPLRNVVFRPLDNYYKFALSLANLIRPPVGHRLGLFSRLSPFRRPVVPADLPELIGQYNEALLCSPLGILASIGLLFLLVLAVASPCPLTTRKPTLGDLGKLAVAMLLVGLLGGFGEVIATSITRMIRCYNRVSIVLACLAYCGLAVAVSGEKGGAGEAGPRPWFVPLVWLLTALALLDQIPPGAVPDHRRDAAMFQSDREFVAQIEAELPAESMVFQLPPTTFPEIGLIGNMPDYSHFRGYAHSSRLRWSYGAMRGRPAEKLHTSLAPLPPDRLADRLTELGFAGLFINRSGYGERDRDLMRVLTEKLQQRPIHSRDGQLVFFRLPATNARPGNAAGSGRASLGGDPGVFTSSPRSTGGSGGG
ncbi:MAG: hypothetical protein U0790_14320 [Isosphaeraceae bacterium]